MNCVNTPFDLGAKENLRAYSVVGSMAVLKNRAHELRCLFFGCTVSMKANNTWNHTARREAVARFAPLTSDGGRADDLVLPLLNDSRKLRCLFFSLTAGIRCQHCVECASSINVCLHLWGKNIRCPPSNISHDFLKNAKFLSFCFFLSWQTEAHPKKCAKLLRHRQTFVPPYIHSCFAIAYER